MTKILLVLALLMASASAKAAPPAPIEGNAIAINGTTISLAGRQFRLWGIKGQPLSTHEGRATRAQLDRILAIGKITCTPAGTNIDNTQLAWCRVENGQDLGQLLLHDGLAVVDRAVSADTIRGARYNNAENTARAAKVGLWRDGRPDTWDKWADRLFRGIPAFLGAIVAVLFAAKLTYRNVLRIRDRERHQKIAALCYSIAAEMRNGRKQIRMKNAKIERWMTKPPSSLPGIGGPDFNLYPLIETHIYEANTAEIGILPPEVARAVVDIYGRFFAINRAAKTGEKNDHLGLRDTNVTAIAAAEMMEATLKDLDETIKALDAFGKSFAQIER